MRVIVASPMKCGSTFVAETLRHYARARLGNGEVHGYYWAAEQNITSMLVVQLRERTFALNMHLLPHAPNLRALLEQQIDVVCLWRNLGDVVISFDDHVRRESHANPVFFIADRERYLALPDQQRYRYVIDNMVPWNIGFYLAWRREGATFHDYSRLASDPLGFFAGVLEQLGVENDEARIAGLLERRREHFRFNVGLQGRSATLLGEENRRAIERLITTHPQRDELEPLLWQLPWDVPALEPRRAARRLAQRPALTGTMNVVAG